MLHRRDFLKTTAAVCAAAVLPRAFAAETPARFPITVRDAILKSTGQPDCWSALRDLSADGIEVNVGLDMTLPTLFHPTTQYTLATPDGIAAFKRDAEANKLGLLTFMMANRFDSRPNEEIAWMKKLVAACRPLGVRTLRIDVVPHKRKKDEFLPFAIKIGKEISAIAADGGVRLGIENHGNTTNDPDFLQKLFDGVGSPNLGLTLDTANFYWYGHPLQDLYAMFRRFAPRAFHTHCKSIKYPDDMKNVRREMGWKYAQHTRPVYNGDIDFKQVARILREANYAGDLCLENEALHHFPGDAHAQVLKKEVAYLRGIAG